MVEASYLEYLKTSQKLPRVALTYKLRILIPHQASQLLKAE